MEALTGAGKTQVPQERSGPLSNKAGQLRMEMEGAKGCRQGTDGLSFPVPSLAAPLVLMVKMPVRVCSLTAASLNTAASGQSGQKASFTRLSSLGCNCFIHSTDWDRRWCGGGSL